MAVNGKSRRAYKGAPVSNALGSSTLSTSGTSITLANAVSGWPTGTDPFFIVIDPGTTKEEKVCVIYNTTTNLIVVNPAATSGWTANVLGRGVDDTTAKSHDPGAIIYPVFTALEANQANELVSKYANAGSVVYQGTGTPGTFTELALGTAGLALTVNSGATAPQWGQVGTTGIADLAVTSAKIADGTITAGKLAPGVQNSGLVYIKEYNATSGTLHNIADAFTTTYDSYRIVISNLKLATTASCSLTVSSAGTIAANNWTWLSTRADYTTAALDFQKATTTTSCTFMVGDSSGSTSAWIDINAPRLAQYTTFNSSSVDARGTGGYTNIVCGGVLANTTTYDGFYFSTGAAVTSLKITVYGYQQG
jgi:hypothetical protein